MRDAQRVSIVLEARGILAQKLIINKADPTGKKNQIRVAFASLGHPIIGDKKYGSKTNPIKRLGLHAYQLGIKIDGEYHEFIAKLPSSFTSYCKK